MNHKQFGLLVKAMRHEMQRQEGISWTQAYLAERANATPKVISNLERGVKARLEPDLLTGLARAFGLSAAERRAFFGLANRLLIPPAENIPSPQDILQPLLCILRSTRQPAFLVDGYDNVVAVNHFLLGLFPLVHQFLDTPEPFPGAYNAMRFIFSSESGFAQRVTENRERYLQHSICRFRAVTLPYRATRYYQQMMHTFLHSADMALFAELYRRNASTDEADFHTSGYRITFTQPAAKHPIAIYAPTTTVIDSPYGALYLVMHIPADMHTLEYFYTLAHAHPPEVYRIASWPLDSEWLEFDDDEAAPPPE